MMTSTGPVSITEHMMDAHPTVVAEVLQMRGHIKWAAQTIHLEHHHGPEEFGVTWEGCPRATCQEAIKVLKL